MLDLWSLDAMFQLDSGRAANDSVDISAWRWPLLGCIAPTSCIQFPGPPIRSRSLFSIANPGLTTLELLSVLRVALSNGRASLQIVPNGATGFWEFDDRDL